MMSARVHLLLAVAERRALRTYRHTHDDSRRRTTDPRLSTSRKVYSAPYEVYKRTMYTSSQIMMHLSKRELLLHWFETKVDKWEGVKNRLPDDYEPKIKIIIKKIPI